MPSWALSSSLLRASSVLITGVSLYLSTKLAILSKEMRKTSSILISLPKMSRFWEYYLCKILTIFQFTSHHLEDELVVNLFPTTSTLLWSCLPCKELFKYFDNKVKYICINIESDIRMWQNCSSLIISYLMQWVFANSRVWILFGQWIPFLFL